MDARAVPTTSLTCLPLSVDLEVALGSSRYALSLAVWSQSENVGETCSGLGSLAFSVPNCHTI